MGLRKSTLGRKRNFRAEMKVKYAEHGGGKMMRKRSRRRFERKLRRERSLGESKGWGRRGARVMNGIMTSFLFRGNYAKPLPNEINLFSFMIHVLLVRLS